MVSDIIKEYEKHIANISKKYKAIIEEHREYIFSMRDDFVSLWSMVFDEKPYEEIKQALQKILSDRFKFSPKKPRSESKKKNEKKKRYRYLTDPAVAQEVDLKARKLSMSTVYWNKICHELALYGSAQLFEKNEEIFILDPTTYKLEIEPETKKKLEL